MRPVSLAMACLVMACATAALALAAALPRTIFARDSWVAFDRGPYCEATTRAERIATSPAEQARVAIIFDRGGPRRGQLAAQLGQPVAAGSAVMLTLGEQPFMLTGRGRFGWSRGPAQEAAIIAAARVAPRLRIEARSPSGGRLIDTYLLAGAPGAIDAAAACAARLLEKAGRAR